MIETIAATMAASAGTRLIDSVATATSKLVEKVTEPLSSNETASFDGVMRKQKINMMKKLFAAFPGLRAQLGEGPYWVIANKDGTVQLSSQTTGNKVTIDGSTRVGAEFIEYYQNMAALGAKKPQKGLEFPIV